MSHEVQDTLIMQKVNAHHREAFRTRFPGQLEHCLRLTAERLQAVLVKTPEVRADQPDTWPATAAEIRDLAETCQALYTIYREVI